MYDTNITQNNFMKGKVKGYYEPGCIAAIELSLRLAFAFGRRRLAAGETEATRRHSRTRVRSDPFLSNNMHT